MDPVYTTGWSALEPNHLDNLINNISSFKIESLITEYTSTLPSSLQRLVDKTSDNNNNNNHNNMTQTSDMLMQDNDNDEVKDDDNNNNFTILQNTTKTKNNTTSNKKRNDIDNLIASLEDDTADLNSKEIRFHTSNQIHNFVRQKMEQLYRQSATKAEISEVLENMWIDGRIMKCHNGTWLSSDLYIQLKVGLFGNFPYLDHMILTYAQAKSLEDQVQEELMVSSSSTSSFDGDAVLSSFMK